MDTAPATVHIADDTAPAADSDAPVDTATDDTAGSTPSDDTAPTVDSGDSAPIEDTGPPSECDEAAGLSVLDALLDETAHSLARRLEATLSDEAALGITCTRDGFDERLYWQTEPAVRHELDLFGFTSDSDYTCRVAPVCPTMAGPPVTVRFTTLPAPVDLTGMNVSSHPTLTTSGPPMVLLNTSPCGTPGGYYLALFDLDGTLRWYHRLTTINTNEIVAQYHGDGVIVWGGGTSSDGAPHAIDLFGEDIVAASWPGSASIVYTHEGRMLDDGRMLAFSWNENSLNGKVWQGFQLYVTEPGTHKLSWEWSSQTGVDAGMLPDGDADAYHGNWADIQTYKDGTERAYASLCYLSWVVAIDVASDELLWRFGPGGDFELQNPDGSPADAADWQECQHGVEINDDELLIYDNGSERGFSRVSIYTVDEAAMTATRDWTWTESGWSNPWLGDADYLPGERVSLTQATPSCFTDTGGLQNHITEVDKASGEVVWRGTLNDEDAVTYRSERSDTCDVMPLTRWCPEVAVIWEEAAAIFGE